MKELIVKGLKGGVVVSVAVITASVILQVASIPQAIFKSLKQKRLNNVEQTGSKEEA